MLLSGSNSWRILYLTLVVLPCLHAELFSLVTGSLVVAGAVSAQLQHYQSSNWFDKVSSTISSGGGLFVAFKDSIKCKLYECCDVPYVNPNFGVLEQHLKERVYGQHLVLDTVVGALKTHWKGKPRKPLVMSFHGFTGCGKNFVASIIAQNLFKNGMKSKFVHHIVATADFSDRSKLPEYQEKLQQRLMSAANSCERSLFILDEVDKMPEALLAILKPFMDYHHSVKGVDFRKTTFILLSNKGSQDILKISLDHHKEGKVREDLLLRDFEGKVAHDTYNKEGGLKMAEIISNHLIDHYIPFLPLERSHVEKCIVRYFEDNQMHELAQEKDKVTQVMQDLSFFPAQNPVYSSSGCKRVSQKANLIVAKHKFKDLIENDEL